jgi:hypothetical protein
MIFVAQHHAAQKQPLRFTPVASLDPPYPDVLASVRSSGYDVPPKQIEGTAWNFSRPHAVVLNRIETPRIPLSEYTKGCVYYGVKTGCNAVFMIDSACRDKLIKADARSTEVIKRVAQGRDIKRWTIARQEKWLIFTRRGIDIDRYPAIKKYLLQFRQQLEPRPSNWPLTKTWEGRKPGSYKWYEIQDEVAYFKEFDKPKIIYQVFQVKPCFAFDNDRTMVNNSAYIMPLEDFYLLGVLNSRPFWEEIKRTCSQIQNGYQLMISYFEKCKIPSANGAYRKAIAALASSCINKKGLGCDDLEAELDNRIAHLYGLPINRD